MGKAKSGRADHQFNRVDVENILKIPISTSRRTDKHHWMHNRKGEFTVKSCYRGPLKKDEEKQQEGTEEAGTSFDDSNA